MASSLNIYSQKEDFIKNIFILRFLEEGILVNKDIKTDERIYNSDIIDINIDSLNGYGPNIVFYKFILGKNSIKSLDIRTDISLHMTSCQEYILGYNVENNNSYRIKGFNSNDLFLMLKDISATGSKPKKIKKILTELNDLLIGVDFMCVFKSLQKFDFSSSSLKPCSDAKELH